MKCIFAITVLVSLTCGLPVSGATWHVEADGTGDFPTIQAAADSASDGDTIVLGAGRFDTYTVDPQWGNFRLWLYGDKSLTFIGQGDGQTIVGPTSYSGEHRDWGFYSYPGPSAIRIENLRFENLDYHALRLECDGAEVIDCEFENNYSSCDIVVGDIARIENCSFVNSMDPGARAVWCRVEDLEIVNTVVKRCYAGIKCDGGSDNLLISDCELDGQNEGGTGIYWDAVGGRIENCIIRNWTATGFFCTVGHEINLIGNTFEKIDGDDNWHGDAITAFGGDSLVVEGNVISDSDWCFKIWGGFDSFRVTNNHFFLPENGEGNFIRTNEGWEWFDWYLNFENNYWGTTDIDEIANHILDGNDPEHGGTMYVDFLPLADGPVSTESRTLDAVKALYR